MTDEVLSKKLHDLKASFLKTAYEKAQFMTFFSLDGARDSQTIAQTYCECAIDIDKEFHIKPSKALTHAETALMTYSKTIKEAHHIGKQVISYLNEVNTVDK